MLRVVTQVGVGGNSCREDEEMLTKIRRGSVVSAAKPFLIADCRPMLNAMVRVRFASSRAVCAANHARSLQGNKAAGKGWETYKNTSIEFFGIHSIHVMRDSFNKLKSLCLNNSSLASPFKDAEFSSAVEDTGWLKHVRTVILGGLRIATAMHRCVGHTSTYPPRVCLSHGVCAAHVTCSGKACPCCAIVVTAGTELPNASAWLSCSWIHTSAPCVGSVA